MDMEERSEDCREREKKEGKVEDHTRSVNIKEVTNETVERARVTAMFTDKQELKIVIVSEGQASFLCERGSRLLYAQGRSTGARILVQDMKKWYDTQGTW